MRIGKGGWAIHVVRRKKKRRHLLGGEKEEKKKRKRGHSPVRMRGRPVAPDSGKKDCGTSEPEREENGVGLKEGKGLHTGKRKVWAGATAGNAVDERRGPDLTFLTERGEIFFCVQKERGTTPEEGEMPASEGDFPG